MSFLTAPVLSGSLLWTWVAIIFLIRVEDTLMSLRIPTFPKNLALLDQPVAHQTQNLLQPVPNGQSCG